MLSIISLSQIDDVFLKRSGGAFVSLQNKSSYQDIHNSVTERAKKLGQNIIFVTKQNISDLDCENIDPEVCYVYSDDINFICQKDAAERINTLVLSIFSKRGRLIFFSSSTFDKLVENITFHQSGDRKKISSRLADIFGFESRSIKHPLNRYTKDLPEISEGEKQDQLVLLNTLVKRLPECILNEIEDRFSDFEVTGEGYLNLRKDASSQQLQRLIIDIKYLLQNPLLPHENYFNQLDNFSCETDVQKNLLYDVLEIDIPSQSGGTYLIGNNGIGKTHLAVGKAKEMMQQGYETHFIQPERAEQFLHQISLMNNPSTRNAKIVWVLDDFNAFAGCNEIQRSCYWKLLEHIKKRGGFVIATSNLPLDELMQTITYDLEEIEKINRLACVSQIFGVQLEIDSWGRVQAIGKEYSNIPVSNPNTAIVVYEENLLKRKLIERIQVKSDQQQLMQLVAPGTTFRLIDAMSFNDNELGMQLSRILQTAYFEAFGGSGTPLSIDELVHFWKGVSSRLIDRFTVPGIEELIAMCAHESISVQLSRYQPKELLLLSETELDDILFVRSKEPHHLVASFLPNRTLIEVKQGNAPIVMELILQQDESADTFLLNPFIKSATFISFVVKAPGNMLKSESAPKLLKELIELTLGVSHNLSAFGEYGLILGDYGTYMQETFKRLKGNKYKLEFSDQLQNSLKIACKRLSETPDEANASLRDLETDLISMNRNRMINLNAYQDDYHGYLCSHQTFGKTLHREIQDWHALGVTHSEISKHLTAFLFYGLKTKKYSDFICTKNAHEYHANTSLGFGGYEPSWYACISADEFETFFSNTRNIQSDDVRILSLPFTSYGFYMQFFVEGYRKPMYRLSAASIIWKAGLYNDEKQKLAFKLDWDNFFSEIMHIYQRKGPYVDNPALRSDNIQRKIKGSGTDQPFPEDCSRWVDHKIGFIGYTVPDSDRVFTRFSEWQAYISLSHYMKDSL
jgi:DNA replication protein DnaC